MTINNEHFFSELGENWGDGKFGYTDTHGELFRILLNSLYKKGYALGRTTQQQLTSVRSCLHDLGHRSAVMYESILFINKRTGEITGNRSDVLHLLSSSTNTQRVQELLGAVPLQTVLPALDTPNIEGKSMAVGRYNNSTNKSDVRFVPKANLNKTNRQGETIGGDLVLLEGNSWWRCSHGSKSKRLRSSRCFSY